MDECSEISFPKGACEIRDGTLVCRHPVKIGVEGNIECETDEYQRECRIESTTPCPKGMSS